MRTITVTLSITVADPGGEFKEVTTHRIEPAGLELEQVKSKLRICAEELQGQGRLDLDEEGKP